VDKLHKKKPAKLSRAKKRRSLARTRPRRQSHRGSPSLPRSQGRLPSRRPLRRPTVVDETTEKPVVQDTKAQSPSGYESPKSNRQAGRESQPHGRRRGTDGGTTSRNVTGARSAPQITLRRRTPCPAGVNLPVNVTEPRDLAKSSNYGLTPPGHPPPGHSSRSRPPPEARSQRPPRCQLASAARTSLGVRRSRVGATPRTADNTSRSPRSGAGCPCSGLRAGGGRVSPAAVIASRGTRDMIAQARVCSRVRRDRRRLRAREGGDVVKLKFLIMHPDFARTRFVIEWLVRSGRGQ